MSIQYINTGSSANAGNGDTLRTAFTKINNNFSILSTASFSNNVNLTAVISHIIPAADLTYDLGTTSSQWRSLYVGTSTIYLGGTALSVADGNLTINGSLIQGSAGVSLGDRLTSSTYSVILEGTTGTLTVPGTIIGSGNLNLASIQSSYDIGRYLRVRDGDFESHIHLDSPDNATYDLIFGDDSKFVRVDHTGTVVIGTNGVSSHSWIFGTDGSLTFPNDTTQTTAYGFVTPPISSTSTGIAGSLAQDAVYFYVCTATNAWQKIAWDVTPW